MSATLSGSVLPRRLVSAVIAALFGLTLALNPIASPNAHAAVTPAVGLRAPRVVIAQVGVPYRYGGTTPRTGFDCSGLTKYAYARVGHYLPRTANQQLRASIRLARTSKGFKGARAGDLVFFLSRGAAYHVGIYAGNWSIYHAPRTGKRVSKVKLWTSAVVFARVR